MKTITLIISSAQKGGAGVMMTYVANLLSKFYQIYFLSIYNDERRSDLVEDVRFISLGINPIGYFMWRCKAIRTIRKEIKANKSDFVLCFMSDVSFLGRLATLGMDIYFMSAERNDPYTRSLLWKLLSIIAYGSSDKCIFQLEKAMSFYPNFIRNKSVVIPNPIRNYSKIPYVGSRKTIVSAGRFVYEKGFDILIEAFVLIHEKHPDYTLIIYGDGPCMDDYKKLILEKGLKGYVIFPGFIKDITSAIANDGVFVLPSRAEGIPNVLIEALAVGIPTVSSDCSPGGPSFLTEGGKNGLLVPPNDIEALSNAILKIIEDENLANQFSKNGKTVISRLDAEKINKQWLSLFYYE